MKRRIRQLVERLVDRLSRSARVFLVVVTVLCGIEVAVDWNATLFEINVQRAQLRQKGVHYADLLRKAAEAPLLGYDWDALDRLSAGLFEDDDVVYVRFADLLGHTLYDRLRPEEARRCKAAHGEAFRDRYRYSMHRDITGMLSDASGLERRIAGSRHRDFIQAFTDSEERVIAWLTGSAPAAHRTVPRALYQDRLAGRDGSLDRDLSYGLGAITADSGDTYGVVLVAFDNDGLQRAIRSKLEKGLGITLFFVGLILVQNLLQRRAKLRLLDLEEALGAARSAIRAVLPAPPLLAGGELAVAFAQAERVGGTVYDLAVRGGELELVVVVPEGSGPLAALAALAAHDAYRRVADAAAAPALLAERLLATYAASPLCRPLGLLVARLGAGRVHGVIAGLPLPQLSGGDAPRPVRLLPARAVPPLVTPLGAPVVPPLGAFDEPLEGAFLFVEQGRPDAPPLDVALGGTSQATSQELADALLARALKAAPRNRTHDTLAVVFRELREKD